MLVVPGLFLGDAYTAPLRAFLRWRGHAAHGWGGGMNTGHWRLVEAVLAPRLQALCDRHGRAVSLVGTSVGGLFVRALAQRLPDHVRCTVTLAANVSASPRGNNVWPVYEFVTGQSAQTLACAPAPVPSTAVFSRSDGMTDWRGCRLPGADTFENVEVLSSHHGLSHHPAVMYLAADRLAQPEGQWRPFRPPPWAQAAYPDPDRP